MELPSHVQTKLRALQLLESPWMVAQEQELASEEMRTADQLYVLLCEDLYELGLTEEEIAGVLSSHLRGLGTLPYTSAEEVWTALDCP